MTEDGCFEIGSDHPKHPCHRCELVEDPTNGTGSSAAWTAKPVGTACDASYPIAATGLCVADPVKSPKDCIFDHSVKVAIGQGGWMGCPQCLPASMDQEPRHFVSIKPFEIDAAEVSANLFLTCIQAGGCAYDASSPLKGELDECALVEVAVAQETQWKVKEAYLPMNCVTRKEAIAFCEWNGKVLCSEAQWERAAVGSCVNAGIPENVCDMSQNTLDVPVYPWGMKWNFQAPIQPCELEKANWFECEANQVLPILDATGLRYEKAMHYDVYGLSGNVAEWVRDTYHANYMGAPEDGSPWVDGDLDFEDGITRGGGYQDMFPFTTTIYRDPKPVSWRNPNVGFRCCSK